MNQGVSMLQKQNLFLTMNYLILVRNLKPSNKTTDKNGIK